MPVSLPPLRALQAFEAFGRLESVGDAARELGVTPGAVSQQLKTLEEQLGLALIAKDGRRATLTPAARAYHDIVSRGFDQLRLAQDYLASRQSDTELTISGLPTLMMKWLNPLLLRFRSDAGEIAFRLEATHREPDPAMLERTFRLTYGACAERYRHARALFTDSCFPVCAPAFLERHPEAREPVELAALPLIEIDWGAAYPTVPRWRDWFASREDVDAGSFPRPIAVHSLSSLALEAAANGQGVALAQASFSATDIELGRLTRLSPASLPMPEPYFVCWGAHTLESDTARGFLNWLLAEARAYERVED